MLVTTLEMDRLTAAMNIILSLDKIRQTEGSTTSQGGTDEERFRAKTTARETARGQAFQIDIVF